MRQLQRIAVNSEEEKESYLKNAQVYMTFQEYLIRLALKESHTTYLIRLRSHRDLTPQTRGGTPPWTGTEHDRTDTVLVVLWGQTKLWRACSLSLFLSLSLALSTIFTCRTCFMLASVFSFIFGSSSFCLRRVIYISALFFFSGKR